MSIKFINYSIFFEKLHLFLIIRNIKKNVINNPRKGDQKFRTTLCMLLVKS